MTQITKERAHEILNTVADAYNWETGDGARDALEQRDQLFMGWRRGWTRGW